MLGIRHQDRDHHLGRETLLSPAQWNDQGWLTVNGGKPIDLVMPDKGLPAAAP